MKLCSLITVGRGGGVSHDGARPVEVLSPATAGLGPTFWSTRADPGLSLSMQVGFLGHAMTVTPVGIQIRSREEPCLTVP